MHERFVSTHLPLLRNRPNWTQSPHDAHGPLFRYDHQTTAGLGDPNYGAYDK